ncbi:MAG: CDP-alcohol phosphatidyltransferase [Bacteroidales bacterium]|jgi:phosphatidylglycerophosphate synthase|nr:CDP-alcohol phosphatidyltransferase [Bacteroidales bacterium]
MTAKNHQGNHLKSLFKGEILRNVFSDRARTNLLKKQEEMAISWLVQRIPGFITSNMLTGIGFFGNMIVSASFILASYFSRNFLLMGLAGFFISWFGDSLDGRLAYYRNKPRKKYGFTLDITIDWVSIILIGFGYTVYADGLWTLLGYGFVVMYGWEMIIALIRLNLTGKYSIDSGKLGPTEVRIIIGAIMIAEVVFPGSLNYSAALVVTALFVVNFIDTRKLLRVADEIDRKELNKES